MMSTKEREDGADFKVCIQWRGRNEEKKKGKEQLHFLFFFFFSWVIRVNSNPQAGQTYLTRGQPVYDAGQMLVG